MMFEYSLSDVRLIIGLLVGGLIPFFVTSQLIAGVSRSASKMVDEVRRQFKESQVLWLARKHQTTPSALTSQRLQA